MGGKCCDSLCESSNDAIVTLRLLGIITPILHHNIHTVVAIHVFLVAFDIVCFSLAVSLILHCICAVFLVIPYA